MPTIAQLEDPNYVKEQRKAKKHSDSVDYFGVNIGPYNHPTTIANILLNVVHHKKVFGLQAIGEMGTGKSQFIATIIHHIVCTNRSEFVVMWVGAYEFQHMDDFLNSLPKYQPVVIVFDDISGALKEMSEKDLNHNFQVLTRIRWILDPEKGETECLIFTTGHYSRTTSKSFRAILGLVCLLSFGNEEATNLDLLTAKNTFGRVELLRFKKISETMFTQHNFEIRRGVNRILCKTDEPLRASCVLSGTNGYTIVFAKADCCNICSKKPTAKYVEPKKILEIIKNAYGAHGVQALKLAMYKKGKYHALGKKIAPALSFIEQKVFPTLTTNYDKLVDEIYIDAKKKPITRLYHKRQLEESTLKELQDNSIFQDLEE